MVTVQQQIEAITKPEPQSWLAPFLEFCANLKIMSKDSDEPMALTGNMFGAQIRFINEVCSGLDEGIRFFVTLKARQLGISTVSLALDLFWLYLHKGITGALITDTEGNRDNFRNIIDQYIESLPVSFRGKKLYEAHNRTMLVLPNGSTLHYLVAGTRKGGKLGRSRAYSFIHSTETAFYGDPDGITSLLSSISEVNPNRFYSFESTADGFNHYRQMYLSAKGDGDTQKAIFIGWWAKETYSIAQTDSRFAKYMMQPYTEEEEEKIAFVARDYGHQVTPEQVAWYRWTEATRPASEGMIGQELPWTEEDAFVLTGSAFFPNQRMQNDLKRVLDGKTVLFQAYKYELGDDFLQTGIEIEQVFQSSEADLRIWEEPDDKYGFYVIGMDPAYGRNDWKDRHSCQIYRCYADRLVQVGEYASDSPLTYQAAWVLAHLCGVYRNSIINVEVSGPGNAVVLEFDNLKRQLRSPQWADRIIEIDQKKKTTITEALDSAQWYLYHRPDSMGTGYAYNWQTNQNNKLLIMNQLRDSYATGIMEINSGPLLEEMQGVVQDGSEIGAPGRGKDDRVFASALAHKAWTEWVRPRLMAENMTYAEVQRMKERDDRAPNTDPVQSAITGFFDRQEEARSQQQWDDFLRGRKYDAQPKPLERR